MAVPFVLECGAERASAVNWHSVTAFVDVKRRERALRPLVTG